MLSPLSKILVKIFVKGYYRIYAGQLLFLFSTLFCYLFYVEVLSDDHLTLEETILHNLKLVLTLISSPFMAAIMSIIWLLYTVKGWSFIANQTNLPHNLFLFYSCTSVKKVKQFKSWFLTHFLISLPVIIYGVFSLIIGLTFEHYIIPVFFLIYISILSSISALVYMHVVNSPIKPKGISYLSKITNRWHKPYFSLPIYEIIENHKMSLLATKMFSISIITCFTLVSTGSESVLQVGALCVLGIISAHSILIFHSYSFELTRLSFSLNFPYSKTKVYISGFLAYFILTLPEILWISNSVGLILGLPLILCSLSIAMLLKSILYTIGPNMKKYLYWVFGLFILFFLMLQSGLIWVLIIFCIIISGTLFHRNYYSPKTFN